MNNLLDGIKLGWYAFSQSEKHFQENILIDPMTPFDQDGANLTITFLSLNRAALSIRLLDSIQRHLPNFKGQILIFDNGSDVGELDKLKDFTRILHLSVTIHEATKNFGVAGGRNRTAELIKTDWFLSLDNDIYLIDNPLLSIKECVDNLGVHFLNIPLLNEDGHTVFTAGPNLYLEKYKDSYAIGTPTSFKQTLKSEITIEAPFLSTCLFGGISVLRTKSFIEQGGYDENMFIGFEDLDFSIRLYKKSIKIGNINKFCAVHGHEAPLNQSDLDYEKTRYSQKIIQESGEYFRSKHNIYAWTEGVNNWIAAREKELELKNDNVDFSRQTEIHNRNKTRHLNKGLKSATERARVALVIDSENWAFHNYARQISRHLSDEYDFQIFASANYENPALL
ncbi:MAG: glycosyltransferase family 2 protein, partial [Pyrinomonadaceae bacterium]